MAKAETKTATSNWGNLKMEPIKTKYQISTTRGAPDRTAVTVAKGSDSSVGETGHTKLPHKQDNETHQGIRAMEIDKELEAATATYIKQSYQAESRHMDNMEMQLDSSMRLEGNVTLSMVMRRQTP